MTSERRTGDYGNKMYSQLEEEDNNQWKFCFSRTVIRYEKQWFEHLAKDMIAQFEQEFGSVSRVSK